MLEIIKLFYKKCLKNKTDRKYYNTDISSWKFLLFINSILMLLFFLGFDKESRFVQLIQVILSGIFISILTYIATIVIPERNQVKSIVRQLEIEVHDQLRSTFEEKCYKKEYIIRTYRYHITPLLKRLEAQFSTISRNIGMLRCTKEETSLFTYISTLDETFKELIELIEDPENNKENIKKHVKKINGIYTREILPRCKELKKYYFL